MFSPRQTISRACLSVRGGIVPSSFFPFRFNFTLRGGASFRRLEGWKLRPPRRRGRAEARQRVGGGGKVGHFKRTKFSALNRRFAN